MFLLYFLLNLLFLDLTVEGTPLEEASMLPGNCVYIKFDTISFILDNRLWMQSFPHNINQEYYWYSLFYFIYTGFH